MTEVGEHRSSPKAPTKGGSPGTNPVSRLYRSLKLFISQILDEMRKVIWPTRSELWNYTLVVILFVVLIMALVAGFDWLFSKVVAFVFAN